jgi:hypothetical protein
MRLPDVLDVLINLINCRLGTEKIDYLVKHKNNEAFTVVLYWLLSKDVVLNLKKLPPTGMVGDDSVEFVELTQLVDKLRCSNINDSLRTEVQRLIGRMSVQYQQVLSDLLCKTLKVGVTSTNVNKAYGYEVIPEFKCMLADVTDTTEFPAYVETKYDGVRCLAVVLNGQCTLYTRHGNVIPIPPIQEDFVRLVRGGDAVFDSELIAETRTAVSGQVNSIIKKGYTARKAEGIIAKVFDVIPYQNFLNRAEVKTPLTERKWVLSNLFLIYKGSLLHYGESDVVTNDDELKDKVNSLINQGEEGAIVKPLNSTYVFKRSSQWGKHKAINSCTLKVIGVTEGTNARKGKIGALICESEYKEVLVDVGSGLTKDDLNSLTEQSIVGKYVEVLFNVLIKGDSSDRYSLFLPRLKKDDWLRIDKTEADSLSKILKEHIGKPMI